MPLPRLVARLNKRYTNRFIEPVVSRMPGFAIVVHTGRHTGATYQTPVYSFEADGGYLVSLTYGPTADWVRNVLTNGGALRHNGRDLTIDDPTIVGRSVAWTHLPRLVRVWLRLLRVTDFMLISVR